MGWPDIIIGVILLIATLKGYKRGFIMELAGAVAVVLSMITPWFYNGAFDPAVQNLTHTGAGAARVIALFLVGIATYVAVLLVARVLNTVTKLPVLGFGNAVAGGLVGLLKGAVFVWVVLYVALFFPLSADVRRDFHRSPLVHIFAAPDAGIDERISATVPWFARPFVHSILDRHRV
jgi:membrane protein required for colicin V production